MSNRIMTLEERVEYAVTTPCNYDVIKYFLGNGGVFLVFIEFYLVINKFNL